MVAKETDLTSVQCLISPHKPPLLEEVSRYAQQSDDPSKMNPKLGTRKDFPLHFHWISSI